MPAYPNMAQNTKNMQVNKYATRALIPSVVGILPVAELNELTNTRKRPTNKFILILYKWTENSF